MDKTQTYLEVKEKGQFGKTLFRMNATQLSKREQADVWAKVEVAYPPKEFDGTTVATREERINIGQVPSAPCRPALVEGEHGASSDNSN